MSRTQLYLDEHLHQRLRVLAEKQGRTVSDLVREAVTRAYVTLDVETRIKALDDITSLWHDRDDLDDTDAYVRRLRRDTRRVRSKD